MDDGQQRLFRLLLDLFDERFQQRSARVEVVMESPAGHLDLVQDILDRHLLVTVAKTRYYPNITHVGARTSEVET